MSFSSTRSFVHLFILTTAFLLNGCATLASQNSSDNSVASINTEIADPWENWNRGVYQFNVRLDQYVLKPIAKSYKQLIPQSLRISVSNFFSNLTQPTTIVNDLLQGQLEQSLLDTGRFVFNSTFGLLGLFDVSSYFDLPAHREDFGQTLAVWGVSPGPYMVLPLLGPSTLRDTGGLAPEYGYTDSLPYLANNTAYWSATTLNIVDKRSQKIGLGNVLGLQLDPYLFVKESFTQSRMNAIFNGEPPLPDDLLDNEPVD